MQACLFHARPQAPIFSCIPKIPSLIANGYVDTKEVTFAVTEISVDLKRIHLKLEENCASSMVKKNAGVQTEE